MELTIVDKVAEGIVEMLWHAGYTDIENIDDDSSIGISKYIGAISHDGISISISVAYTH